MRASTSLLVLLAACGAAAPAPRDPAESAACESARADANAAWAAVAERAEQAAAPPEDRSPTDAERVLDRLRAHLAALEAAPREVSGDEALALSGAVMDAIDAVELPAPLRNRADQAAEALLTDRSEQGALRAGRDAVEILEQVVQAVRPGSREQEALGRALSTLARRARSAADAYHAGDLPQADRQADRAEGVSLTEAAPDEVRDGVTRATHASATVRSACGVVRRLAVPTI